MSDIKKISTKEELDQIMQLYVQASKGSSEAIMYKSKVDQYFRTEV